MADKEQQPFQMPFADLDDTLRRFAEALSQLPEERLVLREEEIRVHLSDKSYIIFTAPLGDTIAEYTDMVAAGKPFSELLFFLFSRCLKKFHIEGGGSVLDGKDVRTFFRRVSPAVVMYAALHLLKHIRDVQFGGIDINKLMSPGGEEEERKEETWEEIKVE